MCGKGSNLYRCCFQWNGEATSLSPDRDSSTKVASVKQIMEEQNSEDYHTVGEKIKLRTANLKKRSGSKVKEDFVIFVNSGKIRLSY